MTTPQAAVPRAVICNLAVLALCAVGLAEARGDTTAPVSVNDLATTAQDSPVAVDVLANDLNLTDPVTVTLTAPPASGTAVVTGPSPGPAAGIFVTYTPDAGFFGEDSFGYTVSDQNGFASAVVSVQVNPLGANNDTATTRLNTPVLIDVLANDAGFSDPVTLTVMLAPDQGGSAEIVDAEGVPVPDGIGAQADLRILYTPDAAPGTPGYVEQFTYQAEGGSAGTGSSEAFTIDGGFWTLTQTYSNEFDGEVNGLVFDNDADPGCPFVSGIPDCSFYTWENDLGEPQVVPLMNGTYSGTLLVEADGEDLREVVGGSLLITGRIADELVVDGNSWFLRIWEDVSMDFANREITIGSVTCYRTPVAAGPCVPDVTDAMAQAFAIASGRATPGGTGAPYDPVIDGEDTGPEFPAAALAADGFSLILFREGRSVEMPAGSDILFDFELELTPGQPGGGLLDWADVTVLVNNEVPVANDITVAVSEADTRGVDPETLQQVVDVAAIAGNSLGDAPSLVTVGLEVNASAVVIGTSVVITPSASLFGGTATVRYTLTDSDGEPASADISVSIPDVAPVLSAADASVDVGETINLPLELVPGNGSLAQHTLAVTTPAQAGTCALLGTTLAYTASLENGSFSCELTLTDADGDQSTAGFSFAVSGATVVDEDGDGIPDDIDNCLGVFNPDQRDTDGDGFGNRCDADFNNDGVVNFADLAIFRARFGSTDPDADLNGDGVVNFADLAIFRSLFGKAPGPSAVVP